MCCKTAQFINLGASRLLNFKSLVNVHAAWPHVSRLLNFKSLVNVRSLAFARFIEIFPCVYSG